MNNNINYIDSFTLPYEVWGIVFTNLSPKEQIRYTRVCKVWKTLLDPMVPSAFSQLLPEVQKSLFLKKEWEQYDFEESSTVSDPAQIPAVDERKAIALLMDPCPITKTKKIWETHILALRPKGLNSHSFNLVSPLNFSSDETKESDYILIPRKGLMVSSGKTFEEEKEVLKDYPGYEIPSAVTTLMCKFVQKVVTGSSTNQPLYVSNKTSKGAPAVLLRGGLTPGSEGFRLLPVPAALVLLELTCIEVLPIRKVDIGQGV